MSARLLKNPGKKHELADDLEAFVHVLRWMCLRFYKHSLTGLHAQLSQHVICVFEVSDMARVGSEDIGGGLKHDMMLSGYVVAKLEASETPLASLLRDLTEIRRAHYQDTESKPAVQVEGQLKHLDDADYLDRWQALADRAPRQSGQQQTSAPNAADRAQETKLSSHRYVMAAFASAVLAKDKAWRPLVKTEDQFDHPHYRFAMMQHNTERSEAAVGSKRSLEVGRRDEKARSIEALPRCHLVVQ